MLSTEKIADLRRSLGRLAVNRNQCYRALAVSALMLPMTPISAEATQVIPTQIEYSNDKIEQGGDLQACVVTVVIASPPAPEVVNFQFLAVRNGNAGFKITAGDMNWSLLGLEAKKISAGNVFGTRFGDANAFQVTITGEGQLVGVLRPELFTEFSDAFFGGHYLIQFQRTDRADERSYYIDRAPDQAILDNFSVCMNEMAKQKPR
jgi:hypothetical protein